jgi:hypothetical protein
VKLPDAITHAPIVFMTGAGASVPLGLPTTSEFLHEFAQSGPLRRLSGESAEFLRFASSRLNAANAPDIEVVLQDLEGAVGWWERQASDLGVFESAMDAFRRTLAESGVNQGKVNGLADLLGRDFQSLCRTLAEWNRKLTDAIYDEVIERYGAVDPAAATDLYRGLLGVFEQLNLGDSVRTIPFFTLNYDIAVEEAADGLGLSVVDGFAGGARGRQWTASAYSNYQEDPDRQRVILVKLHGSVRLGRSSSGALIELPAGTFRDPAPHQHAVLYPTLGPKLLDQEPFRTNYAMLRACLMHAKLFVVIGCTLRDAELNALIRGCIDENDDLRLLVIGPEVTSQSVAERVGCSVDRVGGAIGWFETEEPRILEMGQGRLLSMISRWWMSRPSDGIDPGPYRFGTDATFGDWPPSFPPNVAS